MNRIYLIVGALALAMPLGVWAGSSDDDFFSDPASSVADGKTTSVDPTKQFNEQATGPQWGGTLQADATASPGWVGGWPGASSSTWNDGLSYDLLSTVWLDSRPDKDFRVHFALQGGYPFTSSTTVMTSSTTSTTLTVPTLKVWELFTDVTVDDALYLRFGKQSASWGVSYFYSAADVISLTSINVTNPTLQREGPVALKATVPFPHQKANLTAFVLARDSYFTTETPALDALGYALQGDVLLGDAQLTLGGFYQKASAPKAVATINTGLGSLNLPVHGTFDVFTEAIVSRGSDTLQGQGSTTYTFNGTTYTTYQSLSDWPRQLYYTRTAGINYSNTDYNFSIRAEYLYNPFGSSDKDAAARAYGTYFAAQANQFLPNSATNSSGSSFGSANILYTGVHTVTVLYDMTSIDNSKLEFSTLFQANLSDASGWVTPYFTIYPWKELGLKWGLQFVYGDNGTQYPLTYQVYNASGQPQGTKWVNFVFEVFFGTNAF